MKYITRVLIIVSVACALVSCNEMLIPEGPKAGEVPVRLTFSMADKYIPTKSKVSGTENVVHTMQMVCFDANRQFLGLRDAEIKSHTTPFTPFFDKGVIVGTVPENTARIHFIANRKLDNPLSHNALTAETVVMNSAELSTIWNDENHQEICFWGFHGEDNASTMTAWLNPAEGTNNTVYLIRDRAKVELSYDDTGADVEVTKIEWLIHNGRERGYLAPAENMWTNDGYYGKSTKDDNVLISKAGIHEYTTCDRYSLWISATENDESNFDVAYQSTGTYTAKPQFLFDDDNADIDDIRVILRVTYMVAGSPTTVYHVLRLSNDQQVKYDIVRNNTYYIKCSNLRPDVAFYATLKDAIEGNEFVNAEVEVDRTIPDINNEEYTLQIKLPNEGTSIVLNTETDHTMDFVFRLANDVNEPGSTSADDFEVTWEKPQTFCETALPVTYNEITKQFTITATVKTGQLTRNLQDEWIVVKHKASKLTRYIHVYVIDQFRYLLNPTLKAVEGSTTDFVLSFRIPPMEHSLEPDDPDYAAEPIYPESLYPIDVKFTTNTLNAYGIEQDVTNYGLFGVSVESTSGLVSTANFEEDYDDPVSSTDTDKMTHWYFQQGGNFWDFWYTYSLKEYPTATDGVVNIYFKDVRDHIKYAAVTDVGLFMYVDYFGKNYSVPVTN